MFEFGRELKRILGSGPGQGEVDPGLLELFDTYMLQGQARSTDIDAGRVSTRDPFPMWLKSCALWRELARRSGDPVVLRRAAAAAQSALKVSRNEAETARANLEQALTTLLGVDLYGDLELLAATGERLRAVSAMTGDELFEARLEAAWARFASREALCGDDHSRALEAAALFDAAIHRLDKLGVHAGLPVARLEAAVARIERADLLAGFGLRRREPKLLHEAIAGLESLRAKLDGDYEPLTWARSAEVLGSSLAALGELEGRAEPIAEGVSVLSEAGERFTRDHSPLDWARRSHALGVGLQALGEILDNDDCLDQAAEAFDEAQAILERSPLAIRATVASNRAACLARVAERHSDLEALARAEAAFRMELELAEPETDPVSWAVLQVNLARLYEARGELTGDFGEREAAIYALDAALDIFCERGLKGLADTAQAGLKRAQVAAV